MILLNSCICVIIFLVGYHVKDYFKGFDRSDRKILTLLFFYHFLIAVFFHFYLVANGGDAVKYWNLPRENDFDHIIWLVVNRKASSFMYLINFFPSNTLQLTMFTGNMFYALLGYVGFVYWYKLLKNLIGRLGGAQNLRLFRVPIFPWVLFLPNFHFWSSGIGKDTLLFLAIILFVYGLRNMRKHWGMLLLSLLISLTIRPHISLFLFIAFSVGYILDGRLKAYQKVFIILGFVVGLISIFDYVIQFIQLESLELTSIQDYTQTKVSNLNEARTGSRVDIGSYPFPLKVFTFLYRPLFFDMNGALAILASAENLILIFFTVKIFRSRPIRSFKNSTFLMKGVILFFLIGACSFPLILGNLGIMLRQKNMFMPMLVIFGIYTILQYSLTTAKNPSHAYTTGN